ncbi:pyridoxal biosynthesis lyase PdxS [Microvirga flocculans]|uniref:Pyridoxal biosynthesis lyase PdxS n=1 Tax=Microvirga flocculans TaxID=217168 RepID=A0A7W6ICN1_9HYPH|nr:hypothetical protein [Microvirga flocculans]MBB4038726.1 pyridoxal biosynthesis lyase PdxS [Microvirga flocculans]
MAGNYYRAAAIERLSLAFVTEQRVLQDAEWLFHVPSVALPLACGDPSAPYRKQDHVDRIALYSS